MAYLRGGRDGLTLAPWEFPAPDEPTRVLCDDFNGDGAPDVVAGSSSDLVAYFRAVRGGLTGGEDLAIGRFPLALRSDDFNRDGFLDVVAANWDSADLTVLRGAPGGLQIARTVAIGAGARPIALASGDFDGDGHGDLAVADFGSGDSAGKVVWLRGGEQGLTGATAGVPVGRKPRALATADWNRDELADLAVANWGLGDVSFLRGSRLEGLVAGGTTSAGEHPIALEAGDFDGDGHLDVVVANHGSGNVSFLRWIEGKGLVTSGNIPVGRSQPALPLALASGDYDGDGFLDTVVANSGSDDLAYLRGGSSGLTLAGHIAAGDFPAALESGDYDGDGFPDVVVANARSDDVALLRGGPGGLSCTGRYAVGDFPRALASADYDGDGFLDVVAANNRSGGITYLRGGAGGFAEGQELLSGFEPRALATGDVDRDGLPDLVVANSVSGTLSLFPSRFRVPHANRLVEPDQETGVILVDPRGPPRYRLELPPGVFRSRTRVTQVCIVPWPLFELPQGDPFKRESFLTAVTDCVAILREDTEITGHATLTLRLRDQLLEDALARPEALHVFRQDDDQEVTQPRVPVEIGDFATGKGISFIVDRFGRYVVALERSRNVAEKPRSCDEPPEGE